MTRSTLHPSVTSALSLASDTCEVRLGRGVISELADVIGRWFEAGTVVIVADGNTFEAAGRRAADVIRSARLAMREPFVFNEPELHACEEHVDRLVERFGSNNVIPVAVGSGTINDLVKLASHRCGRPYLVVATAASMDGYTAFGASITCAGSKATSYCPAPRAVIADMDVIAAAPAELNAAGYADLVAKTTAGADWILADALGVEPIAAPAWSMVQDRLTEWIGHPEGVRSGDAHALHGLIEGLLMTGFAMQLHQSSRPASGAEHQFSHLWDMQRHLHQGGVPLHGFKVGIGTLASTRLYEQLLALPIEAVDVARIRAGWPELEAVNREIQSTHAPGALQAVALRECQAKYVDGRVLARRLSRLKKIWPDLRGRVRDRLIPSARLEEMLDQAGAPCEPEQIGIDRPRLRRSHIEAHQIRRRYTVLDLAVETGLMPACLDRLFAPDGPWGESVTSEGT